MCAEFAAVINGDQHMIGPVTVRQDVPDLRCKLSESERDSKRSSIPCAALAIASSTTGADDEEI